MNITYTGRQGELPPVQQRKLDVKFAKLAKLVERKEAGKGAHVVVTTERHLTHAEITVNFYDHSVVGAGSGPDFFTAVCSAIERAEKQALKIRTKWRDTKRGPKDSVPVSERAAAAVNGKSAAKSAVKRIAVKPVEAEEAPAPRVNRVNHHEKQKPMTMEEAIIAMGSREYMAYRDADRDCVSVLIRRKDGNYDLVEP